jgi:hypothetical protein
MSVVSFDRNSFATTADPITPIVSLPPRLYDIKSLNGVEYIQLFDRYKMGLLWTKKRNLFDPGQVKMLKSLWDNKHKGTLECKTTFTYLLKKRSGELGYGRYQGTIGSLEQIQRDIRATLCIDFYWDIDIVNCHPNLAYQFAKKEFGIEMPALEYYCNNRKDIIKTFMTFGLSESGAKDVFIEIINGGQLRAKDSIGKYIYSEEIQTHDLVIAIKKEIKELTNKIIASNKHTELHNYIIDQKENVRGSFISHIIQTEERKCLDVMVAVLKAHGKSVDVLAYDGCMIRKQNKNEQPPSDDLLREIERAIKYYTKYDIQVKVKLMDSEVIDLKELEQDNNDGYAEMKIEWERNHYYFKPFGTIVEECYAGTARHYKIEHATEAFNMWHLTTKDSLGNYHSFLKKWRNDSQRRIIDSVVYKFPEDCKPNEVSVFKGFYYKTITADVSDENKSKYIRLFRELIGNIAEEDGDIFNAMLKNFARLVQKPFERPDICIIIRSNTHGVGKETVINIVSQVIGRNTAHYTKDETFWDKYDTRKEGAILIHLEEAGTASRKMAEALKSLITSKVMDIRPMGVSSYEVPNSALYIMTTNKDCPVKVEVSDRRFFIINSKGRDFKDEEEQKTYWTSVYDIVESDPFIKTIGEYLEGIDLSGFSPRNFPMTEYKEAILENSKSSEVLFLEQWEADTTDNIPGEYIQKMFEKYKVFCQDNSLPYKQTPNNFGIAIASLNSYYIKKQHPTTRRVIYLNKMVSKG